MSKLVFYIGVPPEKERVEQAMNGIRVLRLRAKRILVRDADTWRTLYPEAPLYRTVEEGVLQESAAPPIQYEEADLQYLYESNLSLVAFDREIPAGAMVVEAE